MLVARPTMAQALEHVAASSRELLRGHLELVKLEVRVVAERSLRGAALLSAAAVLGTGAWFGLMAALVAWLALTLPLAAALALVAGGNAGIAGLLAWRGVEGLRDPLARQDAQP
jgi:uncharacterized protein (DUF2062 family)